MFDMHYDLLTQLLICDCNNDFTPVEKWITYYNENNVTGLIANLCFMSKEEMKEEYHPNYYLDGSVTERFKRAMELKKQYVPKNIHCYNSIEGCDYLKIEELEPLKKLGLDAIVPVWNHKNRYGSGNETEEGLTEEGKKLIEKAISLNLAIDLSHANERTFFDILDLIEESQKKGLSPIFYASHSNVRALCDRKRNLTDEQIVRLTSLGGIIGLMSNRNFVGGKDAKKSYLEHLLHVTKLAHGVSNIALSTDDMSFCTCDPIYQTLAIFPYSNISKETEELLLKSYSKKDTDTIMKQKVFLNRKDTMKKEFIDNELEKLLKTGSSKEQLELAKKRLENSNFYKERSLEEIVDSLSSDFLKASRQVMDARYENYSITKGISSCIFLPSYQNKNQICVRFLGGKSNFNTEINPNTLFDIASISKVFMVLLLFKLEELGFICLDDSIASIDPTYSGLKDFTWKDLMLLHGELYTNGNVALAKTKEEAEAYLKTVFLKSDDRTKNKYTDFGAIVMSKVIEKIFSEKYGRTITFDEVMEKVIFEPFGLTTACYNPKENVTGNGRDDFKVHDPKARILGGAVGSAGIFLRSDDLNALAKNLFVVNHVNYDKMKHLVSPAHLKNMGDILFKDSQRGYLGIYLKDPEGFKKSWVASEFADGSFSHQGWTGPVAVFDPVNEIHNHVLVNSISPEVPNEFKKNDKVIGHSKVIEGYLQELAQTSIEFLIVKRYFDFFEKGSVQIDKRVK